jgi:hypothetical protein
MPPPAEAGRTCPSAFLPAPPGSLQIILKLCEMRRERERREEVEAEMKE